MGGQVPAPAGIANRGGSNPLASKVIEKIDIAAQSVAMSSSEAITNMSDVKVQLHKEKDQMEQIMDDCADQIVDLDANIKILESKEQ